MEQKKSTRQKLEQVSVVIQQKTGETLCEWLRRLGTIAAIIFGIFLVFRYFQGDTHKDYKKLYESEKNKRELLLENSNRIKLSIDTLRTERDKMKAERDIALQMLQQRPQQVVKVIRDYEDLYSNIDDAPLDSIADFLSNYKLDTTPITFGGGGDVQP